MAVLMPKLGGDSPAEFRKWAEAVIALFERDELAVDEIASTSVPVGGLLSWPRKPPVLSTNLTGPSAPAGYSATATSQFDPAYPAWKAFDGDGSTPSSLWAPVADGLPADLVYNMPAPEEYIGFRMRFSADPSSPSSQSPRAFEVHGSDDGFATHNVLLSVADELAWATAEERLYGFASTGLYSSYRWRFTLNHGATTPYAGTAIQEIALTTSTLLVPDGWLLCDGSEVPIADYSDLFGVIGEQWNDGSETVGYFRLPDASETVDGVSVEMLIRAQ